MSDLPPPSRSTPPGPVPPPPPPRPRRPRPGPSLPPRPVAITATSVEPIAARSKRRYRALGIVSVIAIGGGVAAGLLLAGNGDREITGPPRTDPAAVATAPTAATDPVISDPAQTDPATSDPAIPTSVVPDDTVPGTEPTVAPVESTPPPDDVPESKATIRNGQIFFEGAVPTAEDGERLAALAAEILGPDNVFNNYVVDPRASDPSDGNITVEDTINFASDSAEIVPEAETLLNQGLALLTLRPAVTITVVGHTDDRGNVATNDVLSLARAEAVKAWYVERGVDPARITTRGAGQNEPLATNDTPEGRRLNRRIQFFLENVLS